MPSCVMCGRTIPDNQGSTCSMCYGDIDYGRDGYYREAMEEWDRLEGQRQQEREQEPEPESEQE